MGGKRDVMDTGEFAITGNTGACLQVSPGRFGGGQNMLPVLKTQALHPELEEGCILLLGTNHLHQFLGVLGCSVAPCLGEFKSHLHFTAMTEKWQFQLSNKVIKIILTQIIIP